MNYTLYIFIGFAIAPMVKVFAYYKDYQTDKKNYSLKKGGKGLTNGLIKLAIFDALRLIILRI
ncbi:hypothetical protein I2486_03660 [Cellulophaga sp. E16_2]|uniref:hypothetical protein n=1 Tax=Cellulophaga sp. E16_2 TaxID=2789297 RepID=UPI001A91461F|nr:hypothetical protein [Cellulophaga sp. E16_2]MBO0590495.1 hypothetical protein [Cellulophaga sp. E16_2]